MNNINIKEEKDKTRLSYINSIPTVAVIIALISILAAYSVLLAVVFVPIVINAITGLISFMTYNLKACIKVIFNVSFIMLFDFIIRICGMSIRKTEAAVFIPLFFCIGIIPAYATFISGIRRFNKHESLLNKIVAIVLFPILIIFHFFIVGLLGLNMY